MKRGLAIKVQLRSPPGGSPVFKLGPVSVEVISISLRSKCGEVLDLEVARLFEIVVIGDKVRVLLGESRGWRAYGQQRKAEKAKQNEPTERRHGFSLQIICNRKPD